MSSLVGPRTRRGAGVEVLTDAQRDELLRLVDADPIGNCVVSARVRALDTIEPGRFGGAVLAVRDAEGRLTGAACSGGNLLPLGGTADDWHRLAAHLVNARRNCTSIVGRAEAVAAMWHVLQRGWDAPRAIRSAQPLLVLDRSAAAGGGDERVRRIRPHELDSYLPAAAAMFREELGISPLEARNIGDYRRRVAGLLAEGRAFGITDEDGGVIFKADIGAVSPHSCQLQGVWVRPDLRGRGIGTAALATVVRHALTLAPTVSLYVNDFNVAARRVYDRLGMRRVGTLSTILF